MLEKATGHIPEEEKTKRIRNPLKPFVDKIYNKVVYGETDRNTLREKSLDKLTKYIETKIVLSAEEITVFNGRYEGPAKEFEFKITSVKPNYGKKVNKESGQFQAGVLFVVELLSTDPPDEIVENNQKINVIFEPTENAPVHVKDTRASTVEDTKVYFSELDLEKQISEKIILEPSKGYIVWGQMHEIE